MAESLYIASLEANSNKVIVSLGIMEMLSSRVNRLGFFRPVVAESAERDRHIGLLSGKFQLSLPLDNMAGVTHDQARTWIAEGEERRLLREIVTRFKEAEEHCDFLLCEGPDITYLSDAFDYDLSVRIARELGTPALYVSSGYRASQEELLKNIQVAEKTFHRLRCPLIGVMVNGVNPEILEESEQLLRDRCISEISIELLPEVESLIDGLLGPNRW